LPGSITEDCGRHRFFISLVSRHRSRQNMIGVVGVHSQ
jgi:hypothetical protein